MKRKTAREIAVHLSYETNFARQPNQEELDRFLDEHLSAERFASLSEEDPLYAEPPDEAQDAYLRRLVSGVWLHGAELNGYISKYARGWKFSRIPMVVTAIMRVAMYEILYMPDIPNGSSINAAVEITKKYETEETARFVNGILGSFSRQELPE